MIYGRQQKNWDSYIHLISKEELKKVKYISPDFFETYRQVQKIYFPQALLCCDSFHIIKNINTILKNANGFRNFSRMRNRIMFSLNKNSMPSSLELLLRIKEPGKKRGNYKSK